MAGLKWNIIVAAVIVAATLIPLASAECKACKGDPGQQQATWENEAANFAAGLPVADNSNAPTLYTAKVARESNSGFKSFGFGKGTSNASNDAGNENSNASNDAPQSIPEVQMPQRSGSFAQALVPLSGVKGTDIVLDISPNATEYIGGAVSINYENFLSDDKSLKPVSEVARILGDAGISENDSVLIYGECQPCGGGPSAATYVYWIMKYLGHKNVRILDGTIDDWVAARKPTTTEPVVLPMKDYTPTIRPELLATYEYVKSGTAQIVDARTKAEFEAGSIPGSINMPYDSVLDGKKIKSEDALKSLFSGLGKDRPVIVYTNTGIKASMVWFALDLLGYDARIYTWQDWTSHPPSSNLNLVEVKADPNPANTGDVVRITAIFGKGKESQSSDTSSPKNETKLTVKGCSDCGFSGFALGAANMPSNKSGIIQLGSSGKAQATKTSSSAEAVKCTAIIGVSEGAEIGRVELRPIADNEYTGIWNANVAGGTYQVTIAVSAPEVTKTFRNALEIEVKGLHQ